MFKHFLITRYNLYITSWKTTKNNARIDNAWMDHRYELFSKYCYPSVINQSNQNFIWLIFLNSDTQEKQKKKIIELVQKHPNIRILLIDGYKKFLKGLQRIIIKELYNEQYLITTRLDNDDCIRKDYIQLIQDKFDKQHKCIIDFPYGLSLEIEPKVKLAFRKIKLNPFISLIENINSFQTVMYNFQHRGWQNSDAKIQSHGNHRPWLQIVHEKNKLNTFKGLFLCSKSDLILDFGIPLPKDLIKSSLGIKIQHFITVFWIRTKNRVKYFISRINIALTSIW